MKKVFYLLPALVLTSIAAINAQVVIGSSEDPHEGAVLELKSTSLGLLLPNVSLSDVSVFQLSESAGDMVSGKGMVVFNINKDIIGGKGIGTYAWDGVRWMLIGETIKAPSIVRVTDVAILGDNNVETGSSITLSAEITPENASNKELFWTVSNGTGAAMIDALSGQLTGITPGSVYVYVRAMDGSGVFGVYQVMINPVKVTSVDIIGDASLAVGSSVNLTAEVMPANASNKNVIWSVTNEPGKATINPTQGILNGISPGDITVTATAADGSGIYATKTISIEVLRIPVNKIAISGADSVKIGKTANYSATITPDAALNKEIVWSVANGTDGGEAAIDASTGVLTAVTVGDVTVTATAQDGSGTISNELIVKIISNIPPGTTEIPNGVYVLKYPGNLFIMGGVYDASTIKEYFTATNESLYLDNSDAFDVAKTWQEANDACVNAEKRLPTLYELAQFQESYDSNGGPHGFSSSPGSYWSSTRYDLNNRWIWDFDSGKGSDKNNTTIHLVRCVWSEEEAE